MSSRQANRPSTRARLVVGAEPDTDATPGAPEVPWAMSQANPDGVPQGAATAPPTTLTDPGTAGEAPAFLYVEKGPGAGQLVPLRQGTLVIGRGSGADLRLVHASISRKHAAITRDGDQFFVRDFGSQNGTFVNQLRSPQEMELFPGDELAIGNAVLRLRSRPDQDDPPTGGRMTTGMWLSGVSRSSSGMLLLVLAAAVSLGLVVALGWAILSGPPSPTMVPEPVVAASAAAAPAPAAQPAPPEVDPALTAKAEQEAARLEEEARRDAEAQLQAEALAAAEARREEEAARLARAEAASSTRTRERPPRPSATTSRAGLDDAYARAGAAPAEPEPAPAPRVQERTPVTSTASRAPSREVLAAYEAGDVARAISLAERNGESATATKLKGFQRSYTAGQRALSQRDGVGALRNFARALKVDDSISKGWGTYGPELRQRLATLYLAAGRQRSRQGDDAGARDAFKAALKYDPKNTEAKQALSVLGH